MSKRTAGVAVDAVVVVELRPAALKGFPPLSGHVVSCLFDLP